MAYIAIECQRARSGSPGIRLAVLFGPSFEPSSFSLSTLFYEAGKRPCTRSLVTGMSFSDFAKEVGIFIPNHGGYSVRDLWLDGSVGEPVQERVVHSFRPGNMRAGEWCEPGDHWRKENVRREQELPYGAEAMGHPTKWRNHVWQVANAISLEAIKPPFLPKHRRKRPQVLKGANPEWTKDQWMIEYEYQTYRANMCCCVAIITKSVLYSETRHWWTGNREVVKMLLMREEVNPDSSDDCSQTPLSFVARDGHEGVVRIQLMPQDVDPDKPNTDGQTPLSFAPTPGPQKVVALLQFHQAVTPSARPRKHHLREPATVPFFSPSTLLMEAFLDILPLRSKKIARDRRKEVHYSARILGTVPIPITHHPPIAHLARSVGKSAFTRPDTPHPKDLP
ncbi:hypothetical protein HOY80DRAFT_1022832 [Tuber brumale]|nr:hypothetical protein HOY80DRAFT_1022832 [Tuber brumale]